MPHKSNDLVGKRFSRLTVIRLLGTFNGNRKWLCRCDCGMNTEVFSSGLNQGRIISCGCAWMQALARRTKHGMSRTPEGTSQRGVLQRCNNENNPSYPDYGGRGILVCSGIKSSPRVIIEAIGHKPSKKHSIDRIDNNGHYSCGKCSECKKNGWPMNIRWATRLIQNGNTRRNVFIEFESRKVCLAEFSRIVNIGASTLAYRLKHGVDLFKPTKTA